MMFSSFYIVCISKNGNSLNVFTYLPAFEKPSCVFFLQTEIRNSLGGFLTSMKLPNAKTWCRRTSVGGINFEDSYSGSQLKSTKFKLV